MVKKIAKYSKFVLCVALILSLVAPSYAALSASDGSAFVTKAEFDSALADFNARLTTFEAGINSKIDSQVTSYLDRNGIWNGKDQKLINCYQSLSGNIVTGWYFHTWKSGDPNWWGSPVTHDFYQYRWVRKTSYDATNPGESTTFPVTTAYVKMNDAGNKFVVSKADKSGLVYADFFTFIEHTNQDYKDIVPTTSNSDTGAYPLRYALDHDVADVYNFFHQYDKASETINSAYNEPSSLVFTTPASGNTMNSGYVSLAIELGYTHNGEYTPGAASTLWTSQAQSMCSPASKSLGYDNCYPAANCFTTLLFFVNKDDDISYTFRAASANRMSAWYRFYNNRVHHAVWIRQCKIY